jgi:large subunit ribosomal protein L5
MSRLKKHYHDKVKPVLLSKFGYKNKMMIPSLKKIIISMGLAEASKDKNAIADCVNELSLLAGQKPVVTRAKKAISNFKLRQGQVIGAKVTLRGGRMYDFLDRFCCISAPRIRDFRGFNSKGDGKGNFSLGLEDQMIFAELNLDAVKRSQGMNITFVTSATNNPECIELLRLLGVPFKEMPVVVPGWIEHNEYEVQA